jgi:putative metallohydrolase (TIGR04338 family)
MSPVRYVVHPSGARTEVVRPRDGKKNKFYTAEDAALEYHAQKHFPTLAHVEDYVRKTVVRDKWFKRTFGVQNIAVRPKEGAGSSASATGKYIRISKTHYVERIVLHEIAHCIRPLTGWAKSKNPDIDQASHGREYAHTYLLLVQHFMGAEAAQKLRESYRKHKIKYTAPREISEDQKAALRARLALYRIGLNGTDAADVMDQEVV